MILAAGIWELTWFTCERKDSSAKKKKHVTDTQYKTLSVVLKARRDDFTVLITLNKVRGRPITEHIFGQFLAK